MYGRTNAGGGGISPFAFIFVTYPAGSVCTCTDGSRTLKLKDTSGYGAFYVPYAATWTVTATDGENTASNTVEITSEGQNVSVELSYKTYLYKNGNQYDEITGGWGAGVNSTGSKVYFLEDSINIKEVATTGRGAWVTTNNVIDFSEYSTLNIKYTATATATFHAFGITASAPSQVPAPFLASQSLPVATTETVLTLDISGLGDTPGRVSIYAGTGDLKASEIWLD